MEKNKRVRVAIYIRVSTLDQSTQLQRKELLEYIEHRGWELIEIYDEKVSGATANRPQFQKMMADARKRRFDTLVCFKLDRLFRSVKGMVSTLEELQELGVAFISVQDQIDLTTAAGRFMMVILAAVSEMERSLILERVKTGIAHAKSKGVRFGRPVTRPDEQIQELRKKGLSIRKIAKELKVAVGTVERSLATLSS